MKRVLEIFHELCAIPHGSGNMEKIADYCEAFGKRLSLDCVRDKWHNVVIRKKATPGYEGEEGIILQGHLDMVCQKEDGLDFDFEKNGIKTEIEGDFLHASGTTLGADNGIAVAMTLAILEREDLSHPDLEAVFTVDEEIGMVGAGKLDMSLLSGKKMINLDSEEDDAVTVSCAGGSEFSIRIPLERETVRGEKVRIVLGGLQGGHSGVEIHKGRKNAAILAGRFLNKMGKTAPFSILSLKGGDRSNVITSRFEMNLLVSKGKEFLSAAEECLAEIKAEISSYEPDFFFAAENKGEGTEEAVGQALSLRIAAALCASPDGVMAMSHSIEGLVETSLNLGILSTEKNEMLWQYALRSNCRSALVALEEKMEAFSKILPCKTETGGHYPPWEYRENSPLRESYLALYKKEVGEEVKVEAIHAGLECGVFAAALEGLDCIAIGPNLFDVHSVKERMSLSSAEKIYRLLLLLIKEKR